MVGGPYCIVPDYKGRDGRPSELMLRAENLGLISSINGMVQTPLLELAVGEWFEVAKDLRGATHRVRMLGSNGLFQYRTSGYPLTDLGKELVRLPIVPASEKVSAYLKSLDRHIESDSVLPC